MSLRDFKKRLSDRHMYSIVLILVAVIASMGLYQYKKVLDYRTQIENGYHRAFSDLVDGVHTIDAALAKATVVNSQNQLLELSAQLQREAAFAQANLGQLPTTNTELDNVGKFLSQVGDYTYSLFRKMNGNQEITEQERRQLAELANHASTLSAKLQRMESDMYAGVMRFGDIEHKSVAVFGAKTTTVADGMAEVEKEFSEYPTLIYDGPFSDHILNSEAIFLRGRPELSADDAKFKAENFVGADRVQDVEVIGEVAGRIAAYDCKVITDDANREISILVSKQGGLIVLMLDNRNVTAANMEVSAAVLRAKEFLNSRGIMSMKESYFERVGNVVTVNFAYMQDGVTIYHDLIKVSVAMDNGEIIGYEAQSYIMNHSERRPMVPMALTEDMARAKIGMQLAVEKISPALIPLDDGREVFCWEIRARTEDKSFLIYLNTQTGDEEAVFLLMESPEGTLAI